MLRLVYGDDLTELYHGDSSKSKHSGIDLIITNPYGNLPEHLSGVPMLISGFADRKAENEAFAGCKLDYLSGWYDSINAVWYGNTDYRKVDLSAMQPARYAGIFGWFPKEMTDALLDAYPATCVWDGFMGRGTVGKSCRERGIKFIGIDSRIDRVKLAQAYILG